MSSRGWSYFLIGIVVSSFLGGAVRVFFSPQRMRGWVEEIAARKQPKFNFEFDSVRLALADGLVPRISVEFQNLRVTAKDQCVTGSNFTVNRLNVPLRLLDLLTSHVKFGTLRADRLDFRYHPPSCSHDIPLPGFKAPLEKSRDLVATVEDFMGGRFAREVENTRKLIHGISIDEARYFHLNQMEPLFSLVDFEGWPDGEGSTLHVAFGFQAGYAWAGGEPLGVLHNNLDLSADVVDLHGRGNLKEGQFHYNVQWKLADRKLAGRADLVDIPAGNMMGLLNRWNMFHSQGSTIRNEWFRCGLKFSGDSHSWRDLSVAHEACSFYGELGDIRIEPGHIALFQGALFPLTADVKKASLKPVVAADPVMSRFILVPAHVSGRFFLRAPDDFEFQGEWREPVLKALDMLKVDSIHMSWARDTKGTALRLSDWRFGGESQKIDFASVTRRADNTTTLRWNVDLPTPAAPILAAFRLQSAQAVAGKGEVELAATEVRDWQAGLHADGLEAFGYKFLRLGLDLKKGSSARLHMRSDDILFPQVPSLALVKRLEQNLELSRIHLTGLNGDLIWNADGRWILNSAKFHILKDQEKDQAPGAPLTADLVARGYGWAIDQSVLHLHEKGNAKARTLQVSGTLLEPRVESY